MELTDFVKDAPDLKTLFEKLKRQKVEISLHELGSQVNLKLVSIQEDYCVVQTDMRAGVIGHSKALIHPYGSSIGYKLNFSVKN